MNALTQTVTIDGRDVVMQAVPEQGAWYEVSGNELGAIGTLYAPMHNDGSFDVDEVAEISEAYPSLPLYPDVEVELLGHDGNAFAILGAVSKALRRSGHADAVEAFMTDATSGDYDHVLQTAFRYVEVS